MENKILYYTLIKNIRLNIKRTNNVLNDGFKNLIWNSAFIVISFDLFLS